MKGVTSMASFPNSAGRSPLGNDGLTTSGRTARSFVKRLVVLFLITLFAAVNAPAEIISAVSYNPSRMGDYVYLKVADKANLKGGIEANTMTVRSGGTVSASSPNLNYNVPAVVGASGSTLDMPNTAIHGAAANTYDNYQAVNTGAALSNCTLKWEERVTSNNQKVKLLALANCNGSSDGDFSGSEKCTWGSKGNLISCQIRESTYCQLLDNGLSQVEIMVSSTCGADRYVANSLSECPTATRGATCVVREQHSNRIACRYGQISSSKTVTMCQGRIYTATCKPSKL